MQDEKGNFSWLHSTAIFGYITVFTYLISYFYQIGFLSFFGIDSPLLEINLNNTTLAFAGLILFVATLIPSLPTYWIIIIEFLSRIFPRKWIPIIRFSMPYFYLCIFCIIIPYIYSALSRLMAFLVLSLVLVTVFIHGYQYLRYKGPLQNGSIITYLYEKYIKMFWTLIVLFISFVLALQAGKIHASKQTRFPTFDNGQYAIIYMTNEYIFAKPIDSVSQSLGSGYKIFNTGNILSLIESREITPKKLP